MSGREHPLRLQPVRDLAVAASHIKAEHSDAFHQGVASWLGHQATLARMSVEDHDCSAEELELRFESALRVARSYRDTGSEQ